MRIIKFETILKHEGLDMGEKRMEITMNNDANIYYSLLKTWGDSLIKLQIKDSEWQGLNGGILCPACSRIHGRCHDAVYPLMHLAKKTKNSIYLDSAIKLQKWSDYVSLEDGSYVNDVNISSWNGITVFSVISLAEAIRFHGELLDSKTYKQWVDRLNKATKYIYENFNYGFNNINYPITASAALLIANRILDKSEYANRAKELAYGFVDHLTSPNRLIYGEGKPYEGITKNGCRPVDLGYNVEESLPALVLYGVNAKDEEILLPVIETMRQHLKFMLPDGGWDNSWGTRNFKWTYWGSRTSDGCQTAYGLMAERDPSFAKAALLNTKLLEDCTHEGLLYGGPHNHSAGELPCVHHTFCHAKALATVLDYMGDVSCKKDKLSLPVEIDMGVNEYPEIATWLINNKNWRATITGYDWKYQKDGHASGGALSLLYHKTLGPVLVASLNEYTMHEQNNMQVQRNMELYTHTPRIEYKGKGGAFRSINDTDAHITYKKNLDSTEFTVEGRVVDFDLNSPEEGAIGYKLNYIFTEYNMKIIVNIQKRTNVDKFMFHIPIISNPLDQIIIIDEKHIVFRRKDGDIQVSSNMQIKTCGGEGNRGFNMVPGFQSVPLYIEFSNRDNMELIIGSKCLEK